MRHIPTSATALRKLKQAAKRIKAETGLTLAQAQDRSAQNAGYEHYHHAVHCAKETAQQAQPSPLGGLSFWLLPELYRTVGTRKKAEGRFRVQDDEELEAVTDALDEHMDECGDFLVALDDEDDELPPSRPEAIALVVFIEFLKELTAREPAFLDGYAHHLAALVRLHYFDEAVEIGQPIFDAACNLIPPDFKGFISYYELPNRPFHRLASNLALAYIKGGKVAKGRAIARKMLKWWPNDNIGFRFYLDDDALKTPA